MSKVLRVLHIVIDFPKCLRHRHRAPFAQELSEQQSWSPPKNFSADVFCCSWNGVIFLQELVANHENVRCIRCPMSFCCSLCSTLSALKAGFGCG